MYTIINIIEKAIISSKDRLSIKYLIYSIVLTQTNSFTAIISESSLIMTMKKRNSYEFLLMKQLSFPFFKILLLYALLFKKSIIF